MVVLGGGRFLMSEVPLYIISSAPADPLVAPVGGAGHPSSGPSPSVRAYPSNLWTRFRNRAMMSGQRPVYFNSMRRCKVQKVGSKPEGVLEFRGAGVCGVRGGRGGLEFGKGVSGRGPQLNRGVLN